MSKVAVVGGGAGGAAAVAELMIAGHDVRFWSRSAATMAPFQAQGGVAYEGILGEGLARPRLMTCDLGAAIADADTILVCLPTFAHRSLAIALAQAGMTRPIVLNPGHTGGALEVSHAYRSLGTVPPPIAEFSTLTYVARKYTPGRVTVTGRAKAIRLAALPGGNAAADAAVALFRNARRAPDVLACDLANVNMVLHAPGAVLGAAWVEATRGDFTFYVQGMTAGVARVMRALDDERRAVARVFGHALPSLIEEMQAIGTVEPSVRNTDDFVAAISSGEANRKIKAPDSLQHRYYREDFGHGLLPFTAFAGIAGIEVFEVHALRTRGMPYILEAGTIRNLLQVNIQNKGTERHVFFISIEAGGGNDIETVIAQPRIVLDGMADATVPIFATVQQDAYTAAFPLTIAVRDSASGEERQVEAHFLGP